MGLLRQKIIAETCIVDRRIDLVPPARSLREDQIAALRVALDANFTRAEGVLGRNSYSLAPSAHEDSRLAFTGLAGPYGPWIYFLIDGDIDVRLRLSTTQESDLELIIRPITQFGNNNIELIEPWADQRGTGNRIPSTGERGENQN